jgi:hypothetical protein
MKNVIINAVLVGIVAAGAQALFPDATVGLGFFIGFTGMMVLGRQP